MRKHKCGILLLFTMLCVIFYGTTGYAAEEQWVGFTDSSFYELIDGSPSMQPLTEALYHYFVHQDANTERPDMDHSRMVSDIEDYLTYSNSVKEWDLLFLSAENASVQKVYEDKFEFVPIAREALVFMNRVENPVTDVTTNQLRNIYLGETTNWQQLNGMDHSIFPYQHDSNSTSQNILLEKVMDGTEPIEPPLKSVSEGGYYGGYESQLVKAGYDNSLGSIGYMRFLSTIGRYGQDKVQLLSVDGVQASFETILSGEYPLTTFCLAVFPKGLSEGHPIREMVAWLLTDDGQRLVAEAGLVPLRNIGAQPALTLPYKENMTMVSQGTGGVLDRSNEALVYSEEFLSFSDTEYGVYKLGPNLSVSIPWSIQLEAMINQWCEQTREELHLLKPVSANEEVEMQEYAHTYQNILNLFFQIGTEPGAIIRTAVFDLKEGKRLELSDLFLDGYNYIDYINQAICTTSLGSDTADFYEYSGLEDYQRRAFSGYPSDYPYFWFMHDMLYIAATGDDPFFVIQKDLVDLPFFEGIPLWHDVSPWGGCKWEVMYERTAEIGLQFLEKPNLRIDDGNNHEAEKIINTQLAEISSRYKPEIPNIDDFDYVIPLLYKEGNLLSVEIPAWHIFEFDCPEQLVLGGILVDMHTGEPIFTEEQARELWDIPDAQFFLKKRASPLTETMELTERFLLTDDFVMTGIWIDRINEGKEKILYIDYLSKNGDYGRMRVSLKRAYEFLNIDQ